MASTPASVPLLPVPARRVPGRWALVAGLLWASVEVGLAGPALAEAPIVDTRDWPAWRARLLGQEAQDAGATLSLLRQHHALARERGDRHAEWMTLAWLVRQTVRWESARSGPWVALAEQALQAAQHDGDDIAAFELLLAVLAARLEPRLDGVTEARLDQADALAAELGEPARAGLVARLRGLAALQQGQPGEALVQYQRALPRLSHPADRADLLRLMAQAALAQPGRAGAEPAEGYLAALGATAEAASRPIDVDTALLQAEVLGRLSRHAEAIAQAQQAVALARQQALDTPLARAQSVLGQAHLAAGDPVQALAHLQAAPLDALSLPDQLATLAAQATALAQRGDERARARLAQGLALIEHAAHHPALAVLRFHESAARTFTQLGDAAQAVQCLTRAAALHAAMLDTTRGQLVKARMDTARGAAASQGDVRLERLLASTATALLVAVCSVAGLAGWHRRQGRQLLHRSRDVETANAQLHAVNRARQRHLAAACHDLRQPAHVVSQVADAALTSLSADGGLLPAQQAAAERCSQTLNDMLDALLDLSVLEQGRYAARQDAVSLGDLLAEVDLQYRRAALDKGLTWQVGTSAALVQADRHLLRRVLFHLASNAVRHSTQGGIQILAVATDDRVWVEVADTGPGLPVEQLTGGTPADDAAPGSALGQGSGLAIVREACRLMAHEVSVPLSSPRGSVVRVTMPRRHPAPAPEPEPACDISGRTVAVVEPERVSRQALLEALGAAGLQAASFVSLAALRDASLAYPPTGPDALVVDLGAEPLLPAIAALQTWRQVCPSWRGPVLALTSDLRVEGLMQAAELGVHLACKPLGPTRLVELLQGLLNAVSTRAAPAPRALTAARREVSAP